MSWSWLDFKTKWAFQHTIKYSCSIFGLFYWSPQWSLLIFIPRIVNLAIFTICLIQNTTLVFHFWGFLCHYHVLVCDKLCTCPTLCTLSTLTFTMEVLAQVQMVTNNCGIRIFRHPMRRLNVHLGWGFFFLLGFGGSGWWDFLFFVCSQCVLIKLSKGFCNCSQ